MPVGGCTQFYAAGPHWRAGGGGVGSPFPQSLSLQLMAQHQQSWPGAGGNDLPLLSTEFAFAAAGVACGDLRLGQARPAPDGLCFLPQDLSEHCEKLRPLLFRLASETVDNDEALGKVQQSVMPAPSCPWAPPPALQSGDCPVVHPCPWDGAPRWDEQGPLCLHSGSLRSPDGPPAPRLCSVPIPASPCTRHFPWAQI